MDFISFFVLLKKRLSCSEFVPCGIYGWALFEKKTPLAQRLTRKKPASVIFAVHRADEQLVNHTDNKSLSEAELTGHRR